MAYRRCCLLTRGTLTNRNRHPSFSYILHRNEVKREQPDEKPSSTGVGNFNPTTTRSFGRSYVHRSSGFLAAPLSPYAGYNLCRYMSTVNQGSEEIGMMTDVADVLTDVTMEGVASQSQAPVVSEVAIAAADSFLPVQIAEYVIDAVHSYTGLNWWAAIVLTTLLIQSATVPLLIYLHKAASKLTMMRPHLEELKQQMEGKTGDPDVMAECHKQFEKLLKEYGVSPIPLLTGILIQGLIFTSFFSATYNMADKMPSFKHGGASWFTDLTTPDALCILPVLGALSVLVIVESKGGMYGIPVTGTRKSVCRGIAVLTVPLTMTFPKAILCYWLTSNLLALIYGLVLQDPGVKKALGVTEIPAAPPTSPPQSTTSTKKNIKKWKS